MEDDELAAIRAQRMAQLQQQGGAGDSGSGGLPQMPQQSGGGGAQQQAERAQKAEQEEIMRNSILAQVLDQQARARLSTIATAKPQKARQLENMIIQMARSGRIPGKLGDDQFRQLLDQVNEQQPQKQTTVKFDRRRAAIDSDSD